MSRENLEKVASLKLVTNLAGDKHGVPGWYTHFGSESFAKSAFDVFQGEILQKYPQDRLITIVGLGSGSAFYDLTVAQQLSKYRETRCIVTDLQAESLRAVPPSPLLIGRIQANFTRLPIVDAEDRPNSLGGVVAISRAVEHYLTLPELRGLITETARILSPGELYIAQISSGSPLALKALSAGIRAIGGKEETFLSLNEYKAEVVGVKQPDGKPIFKEIPLTGSAETQTGRDSLAQARRYLNPHFLQLHSSVIGNDMEQYEAEIATIIKQRNELEPTVKDEVSRLDAIAKLDGTIVSSNVYRFFKDIYLRSIVDYLKEAEGREIIPGLQLPGVRIIGEGKTIREIEVDVAYPIVVWEKK